MTGINTPAPSSPPPVPFAFKDHQIRTVIEDGQPWFVSRDVFGALGISWSGTRTSLASIPPTWWKVLKLKTTQKHRHGGVMAADKDLTMISEPAVYKLAFRSNKPEADEFTNWVASEVLPAIRKTGKFEAQVEPQPALSRRSTAKERNKLAALMDTYIGAMGVNPSPEAYKAAWRKIHSFFGVHRVEDLAADQVPIAERFLQELIESAKAKGEPKALPPARESTVKDYARMYGELPPNTDHWKRLQHRLLQASSAYGKELAEIQRLAEQPFRANRKGNVATLFDQLMDPLETLFRAADAAENAVFNHTNTALQGYRAAHAFLTRG